MIENFQKALIDAMNETGLTMRQISDALEIPYPTMQGWKLGKSKPPKYLNGIIIKAILELCEE